MKKIILTIAFAITSLIASAQYNIVASWNSCENAPTNNVKYQVQFQIVEHNTNVSWTDNFILNNATFTCSDYLEDIEAICFAGTQDVDVDITVTVRSRNALTGLIYCSGSTTLEGLNCYDFGSDNIDIFVDIN